LLQPICVVNSLLNTVERLGPDHYKITCDDFGTLTLIPPTLSGQVYRDEGAEQETARGDATIEAVEELLNEVQRSGAEVSPILARHGSSSSSDGGGPAASSTPAGTRGRRGQLRPMADLGGEPAPSSKRARYVEMIVESCVKNG
jgi:hypothetical protein